MSSTGGIVRFLLFIAVVALGATAYYAHGLSTELEAYRGANALLLEELEALHVKNSELTSAAEAADVKRQESAARASSQQEQRDATKNPRAHR